MEAEFFRQSGADFSPCDNYRYRLWRRWGEGRSVAFIMLNPSTADAIHNDPTIERCHRRAVDMGFSAIEVVNIFAYRATDPKELMKYARPIGPDNDAMLIDAARNADLVICAWGGHGNHMGRHDAVRQLLRKHAITPHILSLTAKGLPGHPLYLPYTRQPVPWTDF